MKKLESGTNFARYALGDLTVIALRDGYVDMPASRLRRQGNIPFGTDLPEEVQLVNGKLRLSVNAFLIVDQGDHILIDTGAANSWEPTMGLLPQGLVEAGIDRSDIQTVALTHTHEDHSHGLVAADGSDAFPNLKRLLVPAPEVPMFDRIERVSRFRGLRLPVGNGFKVSAGVTAIHAHGHEIGHTAYEVSSAGETLLIWGDVIHVQSVQFAKPELTWEYDADQNTARSTRQQMLVRAAEPNVFVAGAHLDFPGVGKVSRSSDSFVYEGL
ncbi:MULTISPECIES: MBL fold metallo-hydrolase [unclassified Rhizobium]|jgi:glyoxylase-like metal-dependent hydrolase (beta-lactamase superfamily II)|uniref:MBL fold metallo-hydrolase n=1 Tax=unclassified Rhizobium TaxID=2613769 RepID=UPI000648369B|nr:MULTISPECIES: MBL fold metallo-hydrolase [unclassified Rhizobium]OJY68530.1 MAG: MBL fold metallo-hydrolase [Rhizobium sp. 60-20]RKD35743.1 glyoxylase-like metal-dependent hydrolase (beta-lactamase superfamily II) [Rhizobium sp. WW_1]